MHKSLPSFFLPSLFIHLTGGNVLKIALYNLEPKIVNSAMMQVSAYHKNKGDQVYTYYPVLHDSYDRVYAFSIFTFTPKKYIKKDMIVGGTGFGPTIKLPEEIEEAPYDWSLYPDCDYSIAWFSRGCIRNCPFCIVREKEGYIHSVKPKNLNPNGKFIKVMDNNFFANPEWRQAINQLQEWNQKVDFQGVDVRLLTKEQCQALDSLKHYHQIKIAWDLPEIDLRKKLKQITDWIKPSKLLCYVLTGFNSTPKQDLERVEYLRSIDIDPFVMVYRDFNNPQHKRSQFNISFARWVNKKELFKTCSWNEFYDSYKTYRFPNPLQEAA